MTGILVAATTIATGMVVVDNNHSRRNQTELLSEELEVNTSVLLEKNYCSNNQRRQNEFPDKRRTSNNRKTNSWKQQSNSSRNSSGSIAGSLDDDVTEWLGGEPNMLDVEIEKQGVTEILTSLTTAEIKQIRQNDKSILIRCFRAEKGNTKTAIQRIRNTLEWQKEAGIENIVKCMHPEPGDVLNKEQLELRHKIHLAVDSGYFYVRGYTHDGRAIVCVHPTVTIPEDAECSYLHVLYLFERAIACTVRRSIEVSGGKYGQPLEKCIFVGDYSGQRNPKNKVNVSLLKRIFATFQEHYPERLLCYYLINPSRPMRAGYSLIKPFLDPITVQKLKLCYHQEDMQSFLDIVADLSKMEKCYKQLIKTTTTDENSSHADDDVRPFDTIEYISLPFNIGFDE